MRICSPPFSVTATVSPARFHVRGTDAGQAGHANRDVDEDAQDGGIAASLEVGAAARLQERGQLSRGKRLLDLARYLGLIHAGHQVRAAALALTLEPAEQHPQVPVVHGGRHRGGALGLGEQERPQLRRVDALGVVGQVVVLEVPDGAIGGAH